MSPPRPPLADGYRVLDVGESGTVGLDDVVAFWEREGALGGVEARRRASEVLVVATGPDGGVVGVVTAYVQRSERLRMDLWHYRLFVAADHRRSNVARHLVERANDLLEQRFVTGEDTRASGVAVEIENDELKRLRNEAVQPRTGSIFIGENDRGDHLRVRYFPGVLAPAPPTIGTAVVPPSPPAADIPPLGDGYRILRFPDGGVGADDVVAYWEREGVLGGEEARRRVSEVLLVATGPDGGIVGVASAYLERNAQLQLDLWYYRTFVSEAHRRSQVARHLTYDAVALLEHRFVSSADPRGAGIGIIGQNEDLKRTRTEAMTVRSRFMFIGETARGNRVRVRYFPGALAPPPPARSERTPR